MSNIRVCVLLEYAQKLIRINCSIYYKSEKIMGKRIKQQILTCDLCNKTPDDGEYMWEMGIEVWCEECCEEQQNESEDETE